MESVPNRTERDANLKKIEDIKREVRLSVTNNANTTKIGKANTLNPPDPSSAATSSANSLNPPDASWVSKVPSSVGKVPSSVAKITSSYVTSSRNSHLDFSSFFLWSGVDENTDSVKKTPSSEDQQYQKEIKGVKESLWALQNSKHSGRKPLLLVFLESTQVWAIMSLLTLVDFVIIMHGIQMRATEDISGANWLADLDIALLLVFAVDALLKDLLLGKYVCLQDSWVFIDQLLIVLSVISRVVEGPTAFLTVLPRALRVIRWARLGKTMMCFQPLYHLAGTIIRSSGILCAGLSVMIVVTSLFAAFAVEVLHPQIEKHMGPNSFAAQRFGAQEVSNCHHAFSSLIPAMTTFFSLSIGDQWHDIAFPIIGVIPWAAIVFVSFALLTSVVLCGSIYTAMHEEQKRWKDDAVVVLELERLEQKKSALERLQQLFRDIDTDGNGSVTWQEFYHNRQHNPEFIRVMTMFDLDSEDLDYLWNVLDSSGDGEVSQEEFLDLMWRLQSGETKWTLIKTNHWTAQVYSRVEQHQKQTREGFADLHALLNTQQKMISDMQFHMEEWLNVGSDDSEDDEFQDCDDGQEDAIQGSSGATPQPRRIHSVIAPSQDKMVGEYMRGVAAELVCQYSRQEVVDFWINAPGSERTFKMSNPVISCDFFVSHCWTEPADWYNHFKRSHVLESYEYQKAKELNNILQGLRAAEVLKDEVVKRLQGVLKGELNVKTLKSGATSHLGGGKSNRKVSVDDMSFSEQNSNRKFGKSFSELIRSGSSERPAESSSFNMKQLASTLNRRDMNQIIVWIDKCCVPQTNQEAKAICISLIEGFLTNCSGMIVLLSWNYFTRLWCVYEWACFLRIHHPLSVEIGCDSFLRANPSETLPLYLKSIEEISVRGAVCFEEDDHRILEEKVSRYYNGDTQEESFESFERFAQCSAIAFIAKPIFFWRARASQAEEVAWTRPLIALAERLQLDELSEILSAAKPHQWFLCCDKDSEQFYAILQYWFESMVVQYLLRERKRAVRSQYVEFEGGSRRSTSETSSVRLRNSRRQQGSRYSRNSKKQSYGGASSIGTSSTGSASPGWNRSPSVKQYVCRTVTEDSEVPDFLM